MLEATNGQGVDIVLDHVGGETLASCLPATRVDGQIVNIGRLDQAESCATATPPAKSSLPCPKQAPDQKYLVGPPAYNGAPMKPRRSRKRQSNKYDSQVTAAV